MSWEWVQFLIIVWLLLLIRRTAGFPPLTSRVNQAAKAVQRMHTSRETRPTNTNLLPLDQVDLDDAMKAASDYYKGQQ